MVIAVTARPPRAAASGLRFEVRECSPLLRSSVETGDWVQILQADPQLAAAVPAATREDAVVYTFARAMWLERGAWQAPAHADDRAGHPPPPPPARPPRGAPSPRVPPPPPCAGSPARGRSGWAPATPPTPGGAIPPSRSAPTRAGRSSSRRGSRCSTAASPPSPAAG